MATKRRNAEGLEEATYIERVRQLEQENNRLAAQVYKLAWDLAKAEEERDKANEKARTMQVRFKDLLEENARQKGQLPSLQKAPAAEPVKEEKPAMTPVKRMSAEVSTPVTLPASVPTRTTPVSVVSTSATSARHLSLTDRLGVEFGVGAPSSSEKPVNNHDSSSSSAARRRARWQ